MIIVTELLNGAFDEGAKIAALNLIQSYKRKYPCSIFVINGNRDLPFEHNAFSLNKALYNREFYKKMASSQFTDILYIPHSSITLATFGRAKLLHYHTRKQVRVLSLQPVRYNQLEKCILSAIRLPDIITQSTALAKQLNEMHIKTFSLPLGVDDIKFHACDYDKKIELRKKYALQHDKKILLHIGHIKRSRNIEWLIDVKRKLPDMDVLMVGSTTTVQDNALRSRLEEEGIIVLREYIKDIEEVYQLADYYVFPVMDYNAAIETPLSVLEAMSTNLPVLTTRYGSLPDTFYQEEYFRYITSSDDVVEHIRKGFPNQCNNRDKIKNFTWEAVAERLHGLS